MVSHKNDFITYHPKRTYILQTIVHRVGSSLIEWVRGMRGKTDIISRELRHLEVVAAIGVTIFISQELHIVLHQRIACIHDILCAFGILQEQIAIHLIRGEVVEIATAETEHHNHVQR